MKRYLKDYSVLLLIAGVIIALDQWTKELVRTNLAIGETWNPLVWLSPYARIIHWSNSGVAFGMFQGKGGIFLVVGIIVILAIIYYYPRISTQDWTLRLALGMQLAGALGNVIDRIRFGQVTDFISVGNFAVFNIADASISIGVAILFLGVIIQETRDRKAASLKAKENPGDDVSTGEGQPM